MSNSSWDDVTVIRKRQQGSASLKSDAAINAARRTGGSVTTEKKTSGANTVAYDHGKAAKIDRETESFHVERVGLSLGKAIQQARTAKQMTQKDLATRINEKPTVVNEYESGKAPNPNQQVLSKMERALGVKLRGKDIGAPLGGPKN